MPKKVLIFYFSGTGNTEIIACRIADDLRKNGAEPTLYSMEGLAKGIPFPSPEDFDLIGLGFAVHAWDAPRIVYEFIADLPEVSGKDTFLFKTAGDPMLNGGSTARLRRKLRRKGYDVFHEYSYVMPANSFSAYDERFSMMLIRTAMDLADRIAPEIVQGRKRLQRNGPLKRMFALIGPLEHFGAKRLSRYFTVSDHCNLCGLCVKRCPMNNIALRDGRVVYSNNCLLCMRCVYICPKHAIGLRRFKFAILKDGYDLTDMVRRLDRSEPMPDEEIGKSPMHRRVKKHIDRELA